MYNNYIHQLHTIYSYKTINGLVRVNFSPIVSKTSEEDNNSEHKAIREGAEQHIRNIITELGIINKMLI